MNKKPDRRKNKRNNYKGKKYCCRCRAYIPTKNCEEDAGSRLICPKCHTLVRHRRRGLPRLYTFDEADYPVEVQA